MVQGVGRVWRPPAPRVERARPFSDEFWRVGSDKGTPIILGWRGGGKAIEDVLSECAPHPAHAPYLTHACARATQVPSTFHGCSSEREQQREAVCQAGRRRRGRRQRAEGGSGTTGGIKKGKRRRGKQKGHGHRQWLTTRGADLRPAADEASGS